MSYHRFHKWLNLIKHFVLAAPNQLYVNDISCWNIATSHVYISLVTDAYSHKVVDYHVADTLEAIESKRALKMALKDLLKEQMQTLIHHSDRGIQYCSVECKVIAE